MIKRYASLLVPFIVAGSFAGCENLIEGPEDEPQDDGVTTQTTLSDIQENVFNTSCAFSGCHNGTNDPNLLPGESYGSLVDVPSLEQPALVRVKPGDSDNSLLIRKLNGSGTARMPPLPRPALSQATIDSIAAWIDRGALNN